jgi:hypothetical protein
MANLAELVNNLREERSSTAKQLRQLDKAIVVLSKLAGRDHAESVQTRANRPRRVLSAAARRRIAAAQRARWAKVRQKQEKKAA